MDGLAGVARSVMRRRYMARALDRQLASRLGLSLRQRDRIEVRADAPDILSTFSGPSPGIGQLGFDHFFANAALDQLAAARAKDLDAKSWRGFRMRIEYDVRCSALIVDEAQLAVDLHRLGVDGQFPHQTLRQNELHIRVAPKLML